MTRDINDEPLEKDSDADAEDNDDEDIADTDAATSGPKAVCPCSTLQYPATHCNTLLRMKTWKILMLPPQALKRYAPVAYRNTHCNTLQRTSTHCNALQH